MKEGKNSIEGQITLDEYMEGRGGPSLMCEPCVCNSCLYRWSGRCPYGGCYDRRRAEVDPYDKAHPDDPPRKLWSYWETEQAFWCRGGIFYPVSYCGHFVKYKGVKLCDCLNAPVMVYQDGYIRCVIADTEENGCERCYEIFLGRIESEEKNE